MVGVSSMVSNKLHSVFYFCLKILKCGLAHDGGLRCCVIRLVFVLIQLPVIRHEVSEDGEGVNIGLPFVIVLGRFKIDLGY